MIESDVRMDLKPRGWWRRVRRYAQYGVLISSVLVVYELAFDKLGGGSAADILVLAPVLVQILATVLMFWFESRSSVTINDQVVNFHARTLGEGEAEKIVEAIRVGKDSRAVHHRELA